MLAVEFTHPLNHSLKPKQQQNIIFAWASSTSPITQQNIIFAYTTEFIFAHATEYANQG